MGNKKDLDEKILYKAIKDGVKEAIHEMMESGDGYSGPIIRQPFLEQIRNGMCDAISNAISDENVEKLSDKIEYLSEMVHELGVEIYKYRTENK